MAAPLAAIILVLLIITTMRSAARNDTRSAFQNAGRVRVPSATPASFQAAYPQLFLLGRLAIGQSITVAADGRTAYVGYGAYLDVLDCTDEGNPVRIGRELLPDVPRLSGLRGDYVYFIGSRTGAMGVVDISDPSLPTFVHSLALPYVSDLAIRGDQIYLAAGGLGVVDISNPVSPVLVGVFPMSETLRHIACSGDIVCATSWPRLIVIDITDPVNPVERGSTSQPSGWYEDVAVDGDYAYVTGGVDDGVVPWGMLFTFSLADPDHPNKINANNLGAVVFPSDVSLKGDVVSFDKDTGWLTLADISDRTSPVLRGTEPTGKEIVEMEFGDNLIYTSHGQWTKIMNVSNLDDPQIAATYEAVEPLQNVQVVHSGGTRLACAGSGMSGLRIIDATTPSNPVELLPYQNGGYVHEVLAVGDLLYVANRHMGLRILEVTPTGAVEVGHYVPPQTGASPPYVLNVAVDGDYAAIKVRSYGIYLLDVSDPQSPQVVGMFTGRDTFSSARMQMVGSHLYVALPSKGLQIIEVLPPAQPVEVGFYTTTGGTRDVAVSGSYAYIADGSLGLVVVDVSDPAAPTEVGSMGTTGSTNWITIAGKYAFLSEGEAGVRVVDVGDPTQPTNVTAYSTGQSAEGTCVDYDNVFLADGPDGLYIFEFGPLVATMIRWFDAVEESGAVRVSWETISDDEVLGFQVLRRDSEGANTTVVSGRALLPVDARSFVDRSVSPGEQHEYVLVVVLADGSEIRSVPATVTVGTGNLALYQNYPNPFNPSTTISFTLPKKGTASLKIYNIEGKLVRTLVHGILDAGYKEYSWNGSDHQGVPVSSGIYFYCLKAGGKVLTKKMALLK